MSIIVTDSAGFIGFDVTRTLLERAEKVIGIDNLNNYFDVNLKHARLDRLNRHVGCQFEKLDVSDREGTGFFGSSSDRPS